MKKCVFLDRDGVLNREILEGKTLRAPRFLDELEIISGVQDAIVRLKKLGFQIFVVTNQPDISRKKMNLKELKRINAVLKKKLAIDDIFVCIHDDDDDCKCRKPRPGMLLIAASKYEISLRDSYMIGDRFSDVLAGTRAGCRPILITGGKTFKNEAWSGLKVVSNLTEAVEYIDARRKVS